MEIFETIQISKNSDGTLQVWSKSHDEVVDCKTYAEALSIFQQFFTGIMDEYHDYQSDQQAYIEDSRN
tara:strand:- start:266 stop:469 length:204 start_codon:yes stop_codon:yes gene_type:complete